MYRLTSLWFDPRFARSMRLLLVLVPIVLAACGEGGGEGGEGGGEGGEGEGGDD